jgi:serine/threonine protein kinase
VDKRSDVWAFGAVLYEMLTGARAFSGEDTTDVIAAVMKDTPNWSALPADVPAPVVTLIQRCLEKDRKTRIGDIAVARFLLAESASLGRPSGASSVTVPSGSRLGALAWALVAVLLISTLGVSLVHFRETPAPARSISFQVMPPESNSIGMFRVSPDGRRFWCSWDGPARKLACASARSIP